MTTARVGRNDLCPCKSGKKYKKCCISRQPSDALFTSSGSRKPAATLPAEKTAEVGEPTFWQHPPDDPNAPPPEGGEWTEYFFVKGKGWTHQRDLKRGDEVRLKGGGWSTVEPSREIRTTQEHPFFVRGKGWTQLGDIRPGDWIRTDNGWVQVTAVEDTGRYETVYNVRVSEFHTYFVGNADWGFAVWAHNADCTVTRDGDDYVATSPERVEYRGDLAGLRAFWQAHPEHNLLTQDGRRLWLPVVSETMLQEELALGIQRGVRPEVIENPKSLAQFADQGETLIWVRMSNGEIRVHAESILVDGANRKVAHTQLSGGEPILAAGQMNGVRQRGRAVSVTEMNDDSGHHFSPEGNRLLGRQLEPRVIHEGLEQSWAAMEQLGIPIRNQYGPPN